MEWWQAVILGLVEGITEFLPISSTGHLVIASSLLGLDDPARKPAIDAFNIVIQGGAILAVLGLYWPTILRMLKGLLGRDPAGLRLARNILVAFIPAAILGPLLDDWIEARLMSIGPVAAALALGGVAMILLERWRTNQQPDPKTRPDREAAPLPPPAQDVPGPSDPAPSTPPHLDTSTPSLASLTLRQALTIGLFQCLAMWPGTSRSMMTIVAGVLVGLKPKQAAEFSFLLGLPTLGGACVYKLAKNLYKARQNNTPSMLELIGPLPILLGLTVATASAFLAIKWLVAFLSHHGLAPFGYYRIALALLLIILFLAGAVRIT